MRVDSTKFGNEAHFMSFAAIIATRNGTEGSNFHIRNTMTAIVEVSGNRLVCVDLSPHHNGSITNHMQ